MNNLEEYKHWSNNIHCYTKKKEELFLRLCVMKECGRIMEITNSIDMLKFCYDLIHLQLDWFKILEDENFPLKINIGVNNKILEVNKYYIDRQIEVYRSIKYNVNNNDLCESVNIPIKDEQIKVSIYDFFSEFKGAMDDDTFIKMQRATLKGNTHFYISQSTIESIKIKQRKRDYIFFLQNKCAQTNNIGIKCEEDGDIDGAINAYEENVSLNYHATHSYLRLPILYQKKKEYHKEIEIIDKTIALFTRLNQEYAKKFIHKRPDLFDEVMDALETNTAFRYDLGTKNYSQLGIIELIERKEKVNNMIAKASIKNKS